ncbi:MAG: pitrilysin family protein [Deltaproteobacteria bacterium]
MASDYQHATATLDNGLTVVTIAMPHLHSATVSLFARVGSRHEPGPDNGLSHFLEHMFFRGCAGFEDSTALNTAIEDLGGYLDGFTTRDYSGYQTTIHPDHVDRATEILGAMFTTPTFEQIDVERGIILEEMLDALDDKGREIDIDVLAHRTAFPTHGLAQPIDGMQDNVKRFSVDDLRRHMKRFYGAKNLVLCFAGRIDPRKCRAVAKRAFGAMPAGKKVSDGRRPKLPNDGTHLAFTPYADAQTRVRLSFHTVSDTHADHAALVVLRRIFDGGLSARLQVELVEKRGVVYEISADVESYADCGLFDFELAVANDKLAYAIDELMKVIHDVVHTGVDAEELERVKLRARCSVEFGLDSASEMTQWFGVNRLFSEPKSPEERLAELEAVTLDDVRRVAKKYLRGKRLTAAAVGGVKGKRLDKARQTFAKAATAL